MATIKNIEFYFGDLAPAWRYCFCEGCPRHEDCLRFQIGLLVPEDRTWGNAVFPTAYRKGECKFFKEIRRVRVAYGFSTLFDEVKHKEVATLRGRMMEYLGGRSTYYRYNSGEYKLTPEQQEWIQRLFVRYGYAEGVTFDHYGDVLDLSE